MADDHNFVADGLIVHNSHSAAYALIAYQTAYLKTHYPVEFMAALLSGDIPGATSRRRIRWSSTWRTRADGHRSGAAGREYLRRRFSVRDGKITSPCRPIKGCGGAAGEAIRRPARRAAVKDLFDLCERVDVTQCNRAAIETLIKAGGMDSFGASGPSCRPSSSGPCSRVRPL